MQKIQEEKLRLGKFLDMQKLYQAPALLWRLIESVYFLRDHVMIQFYSENI